MPGSIEIATSEPAADAESNIRRWLAVANTTFVVLVQVLRVLIIVAGAPHLVRIVARWDSAQSG
jgi:hypothetical protein